MPSFLFKSFPLLALLAISSCSADEPAQPVAPQNLTALPNGGFEEQQAGWKFNDTMSSISTEQAASGRYSLKVVDENEQTGSDVTLRVPIKPGTYTLSGKAYTVAGKGLGIYLRFLDKNGNIGSQESSVFQATVPSTPQQQWLPFEILGVALKDAAYAEVWVHSYNNAKVEAYLDDLSLAPAKADALTPPWKGTYKLKASEKNRLTAADVVGPDGLVYPDWRYAGKPGGIPKVKTIATIEQFGAKANDELDDSDALEKGADEVGKRGGGALQLGEGTYYLDKPVNINRDNVVLRGLGAGKTRLIFRYSKNGQPPSLLEPRPGTIIGANTWIEANADPVGLKALEIQVDGARVVRRDKGMYANATYSVTALGSDVLSKVADKEGVHQFKVIAEYPDGKTLESSATFRTTSAAPTEPQRIPRQVAAISFNGFSQYGEKRLLTRDGKRGDRTLLLQNTSGLKAGSRILLLAPATPRWNALVRNAAKWGDYRRYEFLITNVKGNEVTLNQPLRLDYPTVDGSFVQEIHPIRNCGVEDLYLEQTHNLWTSGIFFSNAWECWARGVTVKKAGRWSLYASCAKWCEFRDCIIDDNWIKGDGGTGYVGWDYSYDCLWDGLTTINVRHAPLFQWSAAGNVVRNGTFHNSDAQWHAGWTNENLIENCVIESALGNGGYGYGMLTTAPDDTNHGPNGPRNVVYNCDISSPKSGVWMGGMNEAWLFLHNRFVVNSGPGVFAQKAAFDHVFKDNVFILKDAQQPAFFLRTPDCIGWELTDNKILGGNGQLAAGLAEPLLSKGNTLLPAGDAPRPVPQVPSIFDWERSKR